MPVRSSAGLCALGPRFIRTRHVYLSTTRWIVASSNGANGQRRPVLKNNCCRFSDQLTAFRSTSDSSNLTCRAIDDAEETRPVRSDRRIVPHHDTWVVPEQHTWQTVVHNFSHPVLNHHRLLVSASFSQGSGARRRASHPEQRSGYGDLKSTGFGQQESSDLSAVGFYARNRQIGPGWRTESREKQTGGAGLGGRCRELCVSHVARGISISPRGGRGGGGGGGGVVRGCRSNSVAGGGSESLAIAMADKEETNGEGVCSSPAMGASATESIRSTDGGIVLTELEETIFKAMVETSKRFGLKTQLRVAGGWVRDKLLGKESGDIDIALDDMLGKDFAEKVNEYLISIGVQTSNIGVIQSNPAQSKHLETATTHVHGVGIDFVNLRSEKYAENSRIPTMEFGSAEQDALRRDLTINSLFYNINTGCVEDFTGRGLDDLRMGIIRTPLEPVSTFLDDPLRVLRAIRFGARFGFRLDDQLAAAAASEEVRTALGSKISRERIGVEVDSMMKGPDPLTAMKNISRLGLFPTVFELPHDVQPPVAFNYGSVCVACLEAVLEVLKEWPQKSFTKNDQWLCLLGGLLMPLRDVTVVRKKKKIPVTAVVIRESLKLKSKDVDSVALIHSSLGKIQELVTLLVDPSEVMLSDESDQSLADSLPLRPLDDCKPDDLTSLKARQRIAAGLIVRALKELWRPALVLSAILDNPVASPLGHKPPDCRTIAFAMDESSKEADAGANSSKEKLDVRRKRVVDACAEAETIICGLGLSQAWEIKPILDGKSVMSILKMKNPGPILGRVMGRVMEWQLANPDGSAQELELWLKQHSTTALPVTANKR